MIYNQLEKPLAGELLDTVLDPLWVAMILEACREALQEPSTLLDLAH